jgi:hypothetical protein
MPERQRLRACVLIAALAVFGVLLLASAALAAPREGPTGPTGPQGATGAIGATGPEGKTAACLPSKATESGVWAASLSAPAGGPQAEAEGLVSYAIPLCKIDPSLVEGNTGVGTVYLTEKESIEESAVYVSRGCEGAANEAGAQPGHLCVFTSSGAGATENLWKNVKFREFEEPDGITNNSWSATQGERVVFRTSFFNKEGTGTILPGGAYLAAGGAWAVTAK